MTGNFEHSHTHFFIDILLASDAKVKSERSVFNSDSYHTVNNNFLSRYINKIWQPPKQS